MTTILGEVSPDEFLQNYWQIKPCLIRGAIPGFKPELDEDDIAGLACEEMAEARLVTGNFAAANWTVEHGPFTEQRLASLPEKDWCLLVQDVEKHYPPLQALLALFDFLPGWRMDDLMVSVSAAGGSVGPHVDQYDVFLLQASGQRRWQISSNFNGLLLDECDLRVLREFTSEQEWILQPGDMLYLPPGIAHYGLALDLGMTWSIGLRAPSQADLLQALGDWLSEQHAEGKRYTDRLQTSKPRAGEIAASALSDLTQLLNFSLDDPALQQPSLRQFMAGFISRYRLAHQPAAPEQAMQAEEIQQALEAGARLQRNPWTRLNWIEQDGEALLFAAGEAFQCSLELAAGLCTQPEPCLPLLPAGNECLTVLSALFNQGHLWLDWPDQSD